MEICMFLRCGRGLYAKGLCAAHYKQQWRGQPLSPLHLRSKETRLRHWSMVQMRRHGLMVKDIAAIHEVTVRTVFKVLQSAA